MLSFDHRLSEPTIREAMIASRSVLSGWREVEQALSDDVEPLQSCVIGGGERERLREVRYCKSGEK